MNKTNLCFFQFVLMVYDHFNCFKINFISKLDSFAQRYVSLFKTIMWSCSKCFECNNWSALQINDILYSIRIHIYTYKKVKIMTIYFYNTVNDSFVTNNILWVYESVRVNELPEIHFFFKVQSNKKKFFPTLLHKHTES